MINKNVTNELNQALSLLCNQQLFGRILSRYPELARTINNYKALYELETKERRDKVRGERPRLENFLLAEYDSYDHNAYLKAVRIWENGI